MKILVIFIASFSVCLSVSATNEVSLIQNHKLDWGEEAGGLCAALTSQKSEFKRNEPVNLTLHLKNVSPQRLVMNSFSDCEDPYARGVELEIIGPDGTAVVPKPDAEMERTEKQEWKDYVFFWLPPSPPDRGGAQLAFGLEKINIPCGLRRGSANWYWALNEYLASEGFAGRLLLRCRYYEMQKSGLYTIRAVFANANDGTDFDVQKTYRQKAWCGRVRSNTITIRILDDR